VVRVGDGRGVVVVVVEESAMVPELFVKRAGVRW
jgi:hypothetical protein